MLMSCSSVRLYERFTLYSCSTCINRSVIGFSFMTIKLSFQAFTDSRSAFFILLIALSSSYTKHSPGLILVTDLPPLGETSTIPLIKETLCLFSVGIAFTIYSVPSTLMVSFPAWVINGISFLCITLKYAFPSTCTSRRSAKKGNFRLERPRSNTSEPSAI